MRLWRAKTFEASRYTALMHVKLTPPYRRELMSAPLAPNQA